jgi:hypothetical protein
MARPKNPEEVDVQDVSVFPEGYEMNSWDNRDTRGLDIARSRTRENRPSPIGFNNQRGKLWFPVEQIPHDMQYAWFTERLLNEPQGDNIQEAYENGWEFVNQTDHPDYMVREIHSNADNRIRRRNNILMKKRKEDYLLEQRGHVEESAQKQREISYLTDTFGNAPNDPRFVVENSGSYTPSYSNRRG